MIHPKLWEREYATNLRLDVGLPVKVEHRPLETFIISPFVSALQRFNIFVLFPENGVIEVWVLVEGLYD